MSKMRMITFYAMGGASDCTSERSMFGKMLQSRAIWVRYEKKLLGPRTHLAE
jgi:hypothetical protein